MNRFSKVGSVALFLLAGAMAGQVAQASALYFEKVQVKTSSEKTCLNFAADVARNLGLSKVHRNLLEVAGEKQGVYISTTCVSRGAQPAMAVVMASGNDLAATKQLAQMAAARIKGIVCFDLPC
ncbi:MAG TPA: hypothetical protein VIM98_13040 [Dyella sp.]|uniref:hypothetical protein n=1 Tax=Dyella sp. TaxID=1869338 RepID=UPI002F928E8F